MSADTPQSLPLVTGAVNQFPVDNAKHEFLQAEPEPLLQSGLCPAHLPFAQTDKGQFIDGPPVVSGQGYYSVVLFQCPPPAG